MLTSIGAHRKLYFFIYELNWMSPICLSSYDLLGLLYQILTS